ncbi:MAG: hypothetical protein WD023_10185 [Ilumatobacteraceae bacterium]
MTTEAIDITTPRFARRFGALVRERRLATGDSIRSIARGSAGVLTPGILRDIEDALVPLDHELVSLVASRYGADLAAILPERLSVAISADGVIRSGPAERHFQPGDETSLLTAYLTLVRSMRRARDVTIVLRRDDVDVLARHLHQSGTVVVERLLAIMGTTRTQRGAVLALFATGAMVIGLASGVAAGGPESADPAGSPVSVVAAGGRTVEAVDISTSTTSTTSTTRTTSAPTAPTAAIGQGRALADPRDDVVGVARATPVLDLSALADVAPPAPLPVSIDVAVGEPPVPPASTAPAEPPSPPPPPVATVPPTVPSEPPPDQGTGDAPLSSFP